MATLKCKMCGGDLIPDAGGKIFTCAYCGTAQTAPNGEDEGKLNLFNRANKQRLNSEFDKAAALYERLVTEYPDDAEGYWGLCLSKYGIEYVDDPVTGKKVPTCHRASYDAITADPDYKAALDHADPAARAVYMEQGYAIDTLQRGILDIVKNEKPFDVFLCYKETDAAGKRTPDSVIANDIYYQLTNEGFKVFYAAITLESKLGQEYEPYIFAALHSARVMLVIGTDPDYFNAVWVRNEWSRYLKLMKTDRSKLLIPCYRDMDAYDLPEEFSHLQAQDMSKIGFITDVIRGIKKVLQKDAGKAAPAAGQPVIAAQPTGIAVFLKRGALSLEDGDWKSADGFFEQALNVDPESGEAYLGKLMASLGVKNRNALRDLAQPFDQDPNFQKALRFGDDKLKNDLTGAIAFINERNENARKEGIYQQGLKLLNAAKTEQDYRKAVDCFQQIQDYKDADTQITLSEDKLRQFKEKSARAAGERKRKAKIIAVAVAVVAVLVIAFFVLNQTILAPYRNYKNALVLKDTGKYEEAIAAFEALDGYKDCSEQISEVRYLSACALRDSEKYDEAIAAFEALDGYKDSAEQVPSMQYLYAIQLKDAKKYSEALAVFEILDGYKDSAEQIDSIKKNAIKNVTAGGSVWFGNYEQDNNSSNGKEQIEWIVLKKEGNKALMISRFAIDCMRFNNGDLWTSWEGSFLREWLNSVFLDTAFSAEEKSRIQISTVKADPNPLYPSEDPGKDTKDKVFLLSVSEAEKYFKTDDKRMCGATDYAISSGTKVDSSLFVDGKKACWWWLRSPGYNHGAAASVRNDGSFGSSPVQDGKSAVRPAMWVDLSK